METTSLLTEEMDTQPDPPAPLCPVCAQPMTDLYPKPRCRHCGYEASAKRLPARLQSCCNPDISDCGAPA